MTLERSLVVILLFGGRNPHGQVLVCGVFAVSLFFAPGRDGVVAHLSTTKIRAKS
jgi:hypothetical protein